jgi:hypothetical protein
VREVHRTLDLEPQVGGVDAVVRFEDGQGVCPGEAGAVVVACGGVGVAEPVE